ncbi:SDR family NAD(P)-dependent oxidoreductase [Tunicatimonas pelagia]|uniref:SDR family NAD(P)-dependent oxidoreductase n=1 Tax=Tunicatimonas pelagia TaxID=931531 RepID=UPI002666ADF3|nr:3-oxoacyl-ACP reductase family protein [Tunicatimonas pelagia]WKN42779.1 3-oxoacyl-ACP reductase FabG [Tunicatimonas pelagia]
MKLSGKIAFVTGASRGIGLAIAQEMANQGAKVVINDLSADRTDGAVATIIAKGGQALALPGDISDTSFVKTSFEKITATWGEVNILVNNAAVEARKSSLDFTEEDYDTMMRVNLKAAFFLAQRALKSMVGQQWGRVINISSVHEEIPTGFCSIYSMTKAGLRMMTRELAHEFSQYGITVNNIAPGAIRTDMNKKVLSDPAYEQKVLAKIPARFIGQPHDVAKLAAFLATDDARYITGATYLVDGGLAL